MRREWHRAKGIGRLQGRRASAAARCVFPDWLIGIVCGMVCLAALSGCGAADQAYRIPIGTAEERSGSGQAEGEPASGQGDMEPGTSAAPAASEKESPDVPSFCVVYVCGQVASPGLYELPAGSRAGDALELAGGFLEGACVTAVNLAACVADGQMLYFPSEEEVERGEYGEFEAGASDGGGVSGGAAAPVNLNTADKALLCTLPGIGEAKAEAILSYRQQHGGFSTVEELLAVSGIGNALLEKLRDRVTVR